MATEDASATEDAAASDNHAEAEESGIIEKAEYLESAEVTEDGEVDESVERTVEDPATHEDNALESLWPEEPDETEEVEPKLIQLAEVNFTTQSSQSGTADLERSYCLFICLR